jgi:hypothetical protein
MYLVDASAIPRLIRVYDVVDDGTKLANSRVFVTCEPARRRRLPLRHRRQSLVRVGHRGEGSTA